MEKLLTRRRAVELALGATGLSAAALARPAVALATSGTLTIGVRDNLVGFSEYNERTKKYYGLEIDLATELAERLGYTDVAFKSVTPDTRKTMLKSGEVDCLVACYSASSERKRNFDFSPAYYTDHIVLVVEKSSLIKAVDELRGLTIGTRMGANTAPCLVENLAKRGFTDGNPTQVDDAGRAYDFDTWKLREYATYPKLSRALESGEIDAMALDGAIAASYMTDKREELSDYKAAPQRYAVATRKGSALSKQVKKNVRAMLDDGTVAELIDKWD